jgi:hypothetical protein
MDQVNGGFMARIIDTTITRAMESGSIGIGLSIGLKPMRIEVLL